MKIVVIGGTGLIGSKLVAKLKDAGCEVLAAAPSSGVNTITGEGLADALSGAQVVVDVTNAPNWEDQAVMDFFTTSSRNLLAAEAAAGVGHHVALSVVAVERLPEIGFFRAKVAQEDVIKAGGIPYTILRATQFFEFAGQLADVSTDGDVVRLPHTLFRPQAAEDVAATLAEIAVAAPLNGTTEQEGPEALALDDFVREVLRARGDSREVISGPDARYFGAQVDDRSLVPENGARVAPTRLEDWLTPSMAER
jgi:uncharacterized protein YbjT (DUF2867 family)